MKKIYLMMAFCLAGISAFSQTSATVLIQYYVDANNNCTYNSGEQLIYNVPTSYTFAQSSGTQVATVSSPSFIACSGQTLFCWNVGTATANTLMPIGTGVTPNLTCGAYNNVPYNTNTTIYLPVTLTGTSNLGVQTGAINYFSMGNNAIWQNVPSGGTISLCSNFGMDSLYMNMTIYNLLSCSTSNTLAPRSYSFFLDNVLFDQFTVTGGLNSSNSPIGVNGLVNGWEYYTAGNTYLSLYPNLPASFSVTGTHTFEVKSSMIYNNAASTINFLFYINSVPCAKVSGRFYNDCNNNCSFDAGDSYGVGQFATGLIYNSSGTNITFNPNAWDGRFSLYLPASAAYSLTQYPTSPANFTACSNATITIPASASTNTFLFGYQNNLPANADPGVYLYRVSSTSTTISPSVGATFGYQFTNSWWNICSSSAVVNPGILRITLPKFINYLSTLSGPTPTISSSATADTLIYTIPNFSNTTNWWGATIGTFSAVVSATAPANTYFSITAAISPSLDVNLLNNIYSWQRMVGGPFDPNGKYTQVASMKSNGDIPFGTTEFVYEIGFQNIGNAPAINVITLDTIDSNFDLNSLRILQSSFPASLQTDKVSRQVAFHFKGINLPGVETNEAASHGFVRYSIKLKAGVPVNTVLKNRAHNYFDFNEPVATNQTSNKLVAATAIDENGESTQAVRAIPNPFRSALAIESSFPISQVQVYNVSGQLLLEMSSHETRPVIDMENYASGVYLVKVTSADQHSSFIKVIKE